VYERKEDCPVCTSAVRTMTIRSDQSLNQLLQQLKDGDLRLQSPSVTSGHKTLYMQKPPALEKATRPNLDKAMSALIDSGDELTITDPVLQNINLTLSVVFE
jgi:NEDD8-activating enzyme E1